MTDPQLVGLTTSFTAPAWLERNLSRLPKWVQLIATDVLKDTGDALLAAARRNVTPAGGLGIHVRTGRLLQSIRLHVSQDGGEQSAIKLSSSVTLSYASVPGQILNDGTMPSAYGVRRQQLGRKPRSSLGRTLRTPKHWLDRAVSQSLAPLLPELERAVRGRMK